MHRAVSLHVGVNEPGGHACKLPVLKHSEDAAWRMAVLASQAGYESLQVLRGRAATRYAVHGALAGAAGLLERGDNLLVTFSGHGGRPKAEGDDETQDESWCLHDGELVDDKLIGYWRLFEPGVRIVVVSESCFSGGMTRTGDAPLPQPAAVGSPVRRRDGSGFAGAVRGGYGSRDQVLGSADGGSSGGRGYGDPAASTGGGAPAVSCVNAPAADSSAIRAEVLMLTAASEAECAIDGVYTGALLSLWNDGEFRGSYCELHAKVCQKVMGEAPRQRPQIMVLGAARPDFALETAFHVAPSGEWARRVGVYRGEGQPPEPRTRGGEPQLRGGGSRMRGGG